MAEVVTPGCALVQFSGTTNDQQPWVMTCHARTPLGISPIPTSDLNNLLTAVSTGSFVFAFPGITGPAYSLTEALVRDVGEVRAPAFSVPLTKPGTGSGAILPASMAAVVDLAINPTAAQPKGGRMYYPGVLESNVLGNALTSGGATSYTDLTTSLQDDINSAVSGTGLWQMVVRSTRFHGAPRGTGVTTPVTAPAARSMLGNQVSRLRGKRTRR